VIVAAGRRGSGLDPVTASCGLWLIEFPWVDQFDPGPGEVIGVASRQRHFGRATDSRDLGVGHTDRPPERFPAADDIGVPLGAVLVEGQDTPPEVIAEQLGGGNRSGTHFFGRQRVEPRKDAGLGDLSG
jgi:hypothetical protein